MIFKVNNKDTRTTPLASFGFLQVFLLLTLNVFLTLFWCFIVNFYHVIAGWETSWQQLSTSWPLTWKVSSWRGLVSVSAIQGGSQSPFLSRLTREICWWGGAPNQIPAPMNKLYSSNFPSCTTHMLRCRSHVSNLEPFGLQVNALPTTFSRHQLQ